ATDPYVARDAATLVFVDYEELPAITNPQQSLAEGAVLIRDEKEGQTDNVAYEWETGDREGTDRAFASRSEEHTSESSHVKISYAVFCLKKKKKRQRVQR